MGEAKVSKDERILRELLCSLVHDAGIFGLRDSDLEAPFIAGDIDPSLHEIGLDSLSEMELCIAIEDNLKVAIVPAELGKLKTLGGVVRRIQKLRAE